MNEELERAIRQDAINFLVMLAMAREEGKAPGYLAALHEEATGYAALNAEAMGARLGVDPVRLEAVAGKAIDDFISMAKLFASDNGRNPQG